MSNTAKPSDLTAEQKSHQESIKLLFEVYKHIITLSNGAIVILSTFIEKVFQAPKENRLVTLSLLCFLASILSSLMMMAHLAMEQEINRKQRAIDRIVYKILYYLSPIAFIFGVLSLAVFAVINLNH